MAEVAQYTVIELTNESGEIMFVKIFGDSIKFLMQDKKWELNDEGTSEFLDTLNEKLTEI